MAKIRGVKATGFSRAVGGLRAHETEMVSGCESFSHSRSECEFSIKLESTVGDAWIRLTLNESEIRDWHMRLSRAVAKLDEREAAPEGHPMTTRP